MIRDLVSITNGQQKEIKHVIKNIKQDQKKILSIYVQIGEVREQLLKTNKIKDLVEKSAVVDILHSKAMTIIRHCNKENAKIRDILSNSAVHLPSKYLFPIDDIKEIADILGVAYQVRCFSLYISLFMLSIHLYDQ